ncbi:hypothetical protein AYI70_g1163 [Smittium culicis]|uniref:Uncharacterized protein n=1 Tax=Smittium culicis TaxID=133412 RepID=A0A1R1YDT9_9FUNG|nr:hypothetical protein AYI70_g1163 [Smittium culicis]
MPMKDLTKILSSKLRRVIYRKQTNDIDQYEHDDGDSGAAADDGQHPQLSDETSSVAAASAIHSVCTDITQFSKTASLASSSSLSLAHQRAVINASTELRIRQQSSIDALSSYISSHRVTPQLATNQFTIVHKRIQMA